MPSLFIAQKNLNFINPLDILRFKAKTISQIKGKVVGGAKLAPTQVD